MSIFGCDVVLGWVGDLIEEGVVEVDYDDVVFVGEFSCEFSVIGFKLLLE